MKTSRGWAAVILAVGLASASCGGSSPSGNDGTGGGGSDKLASECGLAAFADAKKPIEVTFWNQNQTQVNSEWLEKTTAAYNASQDDVHVSLLQFPNYQDLLTKYLAGLSSGDLPDLFQPEDTAVQRLIDSGSTVPMQACVNADNYSLEDFLPRATAFYSYKNVLQGMPWTVSNIVLWYNVTAFEKAGLDPKNPPATLAEVMSASRKIVESGVTKYGIALRVEPYVFEFLNAKSGGTYVNRGNGREGRATASTIDTPTAEKIWTWWNEMVESGLAVNTGGATGNIDHMLAVGTGNAAMTMEASGVLGTVRDALERGEYQVKIGVGPLPSLDGGGGVPVGDGSLWIPKASAPAKRAAAWQFVKYLSSAKEQADLAASLGYVPVRTSAAAVAELQQTWARDPIFKVAYDQLVSGPTNAATIGSLIGDYQGVRDAVKDGMLSMLTGGLSPQAALAKAQKQADASIETYNTRLGVD